LRPAGALLFLPAKKSRQKKAALRLPAIALRPMVGSLTPRNQSGEEKNSAYASDSFSSFTRINFILFGGTQRDGKVNVKVMERATDEPSAALAIMKSR